MVFSKRLARSLVTARIFLTADLDAVNASEHISLAHNPSSNMNNGVGYTPVVKSKHPPQLGTDGIGADMWREARVAEFKSHNAQLPMAFGRSLEMLGQSARFASDALGVKLGVLEPGAAADLVLTTIAPQRRLRANNLAGHFLFAMGPELSRDVMIAGEWRLCKMGRWFPATNLRCARSLLKWRCASGDECPRCD